MLPTVGKSQTRLWRRKATDIFPVMSCLPRLCRKSRGPTCPTPFCCWRQWVKDSYDSYDSYESSQLSWWGFYGFLVRPWASKTCWALTSWTLRPSETMGLCQTMGELVMECRCVSDIQQPSKIVMQWMGFMCWWYTSARNDQQRPREEALGTWPGCCLRPVETLINALESLWQTTQRFAAA